MLNFYYVTSECFIVYQGRVYIGFEATRSDANQPKSDVIDNLWLVATHHKLHERLLNFTSKNADEWLAYFEQVT